MTIFLGITQNPIGTSAEIGDQLTFSCISSPSPPGVTPSTYWRADGNAIASGSYSYLENKADEVISYLVLFSVTGTMDGNYVCFISFNEQVLESQSATLSVEGIKSFPTAARGVDENGVIITCISSGDSFGTDIVWYKDGDSVSSTGLGVLSNPGTFYKNIIFIQFICVLCAL